MHAKYTQRIFTYLVKEGSTKQKVTKQLVDEQGTTHTVEQEIEVPLFKECTMIYESLSGGVSLADMTEQKMIADAMYKHGGELVQAKATQDKARMIDVPVV